MHDHGTWPLVFPMLDPTRASPSSRKTPATLSRKRKTTERIKALFARRFQNPTTGNSAVKIHLVVIGNGMVGHRFIQQMVEKGAYRDFAITIVGGERHPAYDRVNLTKLFFGKEFHSMHLARKGWHDEHDITEILGDMATMVDRVEKVVHLSSGRVLSYDLLVFATGSEPVRPDIPGASGKDVYVYRSVEDIWKLKERCSTARSAAVIGGGLLGLEAADAMKHLGLETHVVERGSGLLVRQLNPEGSTCLQKHVESLGMTVHNAKVTHTIWDGEGGKRIWFGDGTSLVVDIVIFAVGIKPRDELARACDLKLSGLGGIEVDEHLRTSDPAIFAIGECVRFRGTLYGLVLPGYEMAAVLAENLNGGNSRFDDADRSAVLKLNGAEVAAVGDFQANGNTFTQTGEHTYHQIILQRGRLIGAISVGPWEEQARIREAVKVQKRIWPWQTRRFIREGRLWDNSETTNVLAWPESAEICNCLAIRKNILTAACASGCTTVEGLVEKTGASTVCGSCRPLLAQLMGAWETEPVRPRGRPALALASIVAVLSTFTLLLWPGWQLETTVQKVSLLDILITDPFIKKVTGFTILGCAVLSLLLSLRKRISKIRIGDYGIWKAIHACLGGLGLIILVTHTGFHLGSNLNFILMINFLALAALGGAAGFVHAMERNQSSGHVLARRLMTLGHIVLFWTFPVLLFFHVLKVYYY